MTQHGSFPGRPRGRRARPDTGAPEGTGYDAAQGEREFPDLTPIRPLEARARDGGVPGDGYPAQSGAYPDQGTHRVPGPGYPPNGPGPGGYGDGQPGGQYRGAEHPGSGEGQAPWDDLDRGWPGQQLAPEPWPDQASRTGQQPAQPGEPGSQQSGPQQAAPRTGPQPSRPERSPGAKDDEDVPSWAEPDSVEAFSSRWHRRGLDSRNERRAGRRNRRRLLISAGIVLALIVGTLAYLLSGGPGAADLGFGGFVTTFQQGELQQVPNPCTTLSAATVQQYLPGQSKQAAPPLNSGASTECTWTLDNAPTYRVLQVQLQAYSPSGLASGNGSATFAALDAFGSFENRYAKPGPKSGQPKAAVTDLSGMPGGNDTSAFQATQVFNRGGATMDVANVLVRYRNVIITVVVDGLSQSSGKKYGPVAMSDLAVVADTVAKQMATQIVK